MKHLIFILLFSLALTGTGVAQGSGDIYIRNSLNRLLSLRNVECEIRMETFVDGQEYAARGHYSEQALPQAVREAFLRSVYRLDITFLTSTPVGALSAPNQLTLVCYASEDGQNHRIEQCVTIEGVKVFSIVDLKRLEHRLRTTQREVFFSQAGEVRNLGGLAGKMRQISRFYEFSLPVQETLQVPVRDSLQKEDAVPVLKLSGTLRSLHYSDLLASFGGLSPQGHYPREFPSDIEIWIGQLDDFPYRIRYLRRTSADSEQKSLLFQESFFNVVLDGETLPRTKFDRLTIPDDVLSVSDETDNVIRALGL